ncbi:hypothetical protein ABR772_25725 [Bacillus cereus]|uniref:hypothetical protein n=1 Tax=Bacillus cereus TaxID=1396 RepID=UPI003556BFFF
MKETMTLIGVGTVLGTPAGELKVGDITRWNYGGIERITSIEFSKTGKTIIVGIEYMDYDNQVITSERKFRTTRLVNIIGRGNTKLTGKYNFRSEEETNLVAKYMSNPVFKYTEVGEVEEAPVLVETVKAEEVAEVVEETTEEVIEEVHEVGTMIVHPETKEIVTEDMFLSYPNWKETDFIKVTNCKETKTPEGVALTGEINGQPFTATLSENDYFNGKNFILPELTNNNKGEEFGVIKTINREDLTHEQKNVLKAINYWVREIELERKNDNNIARLTDWGKTLRQWFEEADALKVGFVLQNKAVQLANSGQDMGYYFAYGKE